MRQVVTTLTIKNTRTVTDDLYEAYEMYDEEGSEDSEKYLANLIVEELKEDDGEAVELYVNDGELVDVKVEFVDVPDC